MLKSLAAEGRTVLVSSHLMSEMALTATRLVVIGRGRLIADTTVSEFVARSSHNSVTVGSPAAGQLREQLLGPDVVVTSTQRDFLQVTGLTAEQIGTIAWKSHLPLFELTAQQASLEEAFIEMTHESVEYRSTDTAAVSA
jgi:ABC-2 type transport system ATP-binding protein